VSTLADLAGRDRACLARRPGAGVAPD
jgi:hypothetical protein